MGDGFAFWYRKSHITRFRLSVLLFIVFISILFCPAAASAVVDVTLAWDASSGADGYRLFYREDGQGYNYATPDWEGSGTTCTIYGLDDLTTYHFVVRAYNADGESGDSNEETLSPASNPVISLSSTSLANSSTEGTNAPSQTFEVSNSGGGTLSYSISDNRSWLSVSPSSGTSTGEQDTITVNYNTSGLSAGSRTATITISDPNADNDPQTISVSLTVDALPPSISLSTSSLSNSSTEGTNAPSQTFEISNSGGGTLSYSISDNRSWLSVSPSSGTSTGEQDTITVNYNTSGLTARTRNAIITISDPNADNSPQTISVSLTVNAVNNQLPTASFTATPTSGDAPLAVGFNASGSSDPDGSIVSYSWNFGDSTTGSGMTSGHTYNDSGNYTVTLTVTDNDGATDSSSRLIQVTEPPASNLPPNQPVISSPYDGELETDLLLSVETEPFSDPDGDAHLETQWQIVKATDSSVVLEIVSNKHLTEIPVPHAVLDRNTTYNVSVQFVDAHAEPSPWSDPVEFTTHNGVVDLDGDGIPDDSEVDDTVDLNQDGTPDNDQPDVIKSAKSAVAGKQPLGVCKTGTDVNGIVVLEPIHPSEILDKKNKPKKFLYGLVAYRLQVPQQGGTVQVKVYYADDISGATRYYLYDTVNGWQDYTQYTTFNPDGRSVTVELKDGGHGDSDGVANGFIVDPGGVAGAASGGLDSGAGGGCFIASAAFGSDEEPHVELHATSYTEGHDWLKPIVRVLIIPLVGVSYILTRTSLVITILVGFLLIISLISFYTVIYRRRKYQI